MGIYFYPFIQKSRYRMLKWQRPSIQCVKMIRGLKINTINREISFFYLIFATIFALQGCEAKSLDLADSGRVNIETIQSKAGHV